MKLTSKTRYHLFWSGIGFGAMLVISAIVYLQLESMAGHYPIEYGTEPYDQNPVSSNICPSS